MGRACEFPTTGVLVPASLDFGVVTLGSRGAVRTVYFTNTSMLNMRILAITPAGANSGDFALVTTCTTGSGTNMAPGANCAITVTFTPGGTGPRSATLAVSATLHRENSGGSTDYSSDLSLTTSLTGSGTVAVSGIVIDPATPSRLYGAIDGAGVFRSADGGAHWTAAAVQPTNLRVKALVIKPGASATLYAATYGGGVFKSANSGVTWGACAVQPGSLDLLSLTIDAGGNLFAGSEAGVFVSGDACASWTPMNTGLPL
jgi:hypothetical protein